MGNQWSHLQLRSHWHDLVLDLVAKDALRWCSNCFLDLPVEFVPTEGKAQVERASCFIVSCEENAVYLYRYRYISWETRSTKLPGRLAPMSNFYGFLDGVDPRTRSSTLVNETLPITMGNPSTRFGRCLCTFVCPSKSSNVCRAFFTNGSSGQVKRRVVSSMHINAFQCSPCAPQGGMDLDAFGCTNRKYVSRDMSTQTLL